MTPPATTQTVIGGATATTAAKERLLTPRFLYLGFVTAVYSLASSSLSPVLPRYVKDELGRSNAAVGLVAGATAIGALLVRLVIARWGTRLAPERLMAAGLLACGCVLVTTRAADSVSRLLPLRVVFGAGNGAAFVSVVMVAMLLAVPSRRGEAATVSLLAVHLGVGSGPLVGEWLLHQWSYDVVWTVAGAAMFVSAAMAAMIRTPPTEMPPPAKDGERLPMFDRRAVFPGLANAIGQLPFLGFSTFLPLYGREIGMSDVAPVFLTVSATMVVVRAAGKKLPDRLGPARGGTVALAFVFSGLLITAGWHQPLGLFLGAMVLGCGTAIMYPALMLGVVARVSEAERPRALATFSVCQDVTIATGGAVNGAIASAVGYRGTFVVGAGLCALDIVLIQRRARRTGSRYLA